MRDPDLDQAIVDMRQTFADLRRARGQLKHAEVRASLNKTGAVKAQIADCLGLIAVRAGRLGISPAGLTVILSAYARERTRLKRWPSAKQVTALLRADRTASARYVEVTCDALKRAEAEAAQALDDDAAAEAACVAFTGYPN